METNNPEEQEIMNDDDPDNGVLEISVDSRHIEPWLLVEIRVVLGAVRKETPVVSNAVATGSEGDDPQHNRNRIANGYIKDPVLVVIESWSSFIQHNWTEQDLSDESSEERRWVVSRVVQKCLHNAQALVILHVFALGKEKIRDRVNEVSNLKEEHDPILVANTIAETDERVNHN